MKIKKLIKNLQALQTKLGDRITVVVDVRAAQSNYIALEDYTHWSISKIKVESVEVENEETGNQKSYKVVSLTISAE